MSLIENEDGWIVAFHSRNYKLMSRHGWSSLIANYSYDLLSKMINILLEMSIMRLWSTQYSGLKREFLL